MGYTVTYGPAGGKSERHRGKFTFILLTGFFFALFCMFARYRYSEELRTLSGIIFPGGAVETLIRDIQEGESVTDAVAVFCQDLLNGR